MESIGFKEWSLVCDALGRGEQSVILRKGGIAEGRQGFSFRHREFFLFPTFFHEQVGKVRNGATFKKAENDREITISFYAELEQALRIDSLEVAEALWPLHILKPEVVHERFDYRGNGLNAAFLRVFRLEQPWILANEKRYRGCKSWLELPAAPEISIKPVLDDAEHEKRRAMFSATILSS